MAPLKSLILNISISAASNSLNLLVNNNWIMVYCWLKFCGGATIGSRDIIKYVVVRSGILWSIIAIWECTPLITTPDKAMPTLSYAMKVSKYSTTFISDHLY